MSTITLDIPRGWAGAIEDAGIDLDKVIDRGALVVALHSGLFNKLRELGDEIASLDDMDTDTDRVRFVSDSRDRAEEVIRIVDAIKHLDQPVGAEQTPAEVAR